METNEEKKLNASKIKEFVIKKKNWLQYIILAIIITIGAWIRSQPLKNLIDATTGKYITLELDSTLWLRYAKHIVENGRLFDIDPLRSAPFGADISQLGTFTSYFIAYLYKILNLFIPSITIEYVDIIYPIIATAVLSVFLFLLVKRLFDWRVGLLSVLFINIMPSFLFRSLGGSSDHDILGMMFFVMALYFYVVAWQSNQIKYNFLFGVIAGTVTAVGYLTAGLITFVYFIIGIFLTIELFLEKFDKKDYYVLISWLGTSVLFLTFILNRVSISAFVSSLTTVPAFFVLVASTFYLFVFQKNFANIRNKIKFPGGLFSILFSALFIFLIGFIFLGGVDFLVNKFNLLAGQFETFRASRWVTTVAENHRPYITDWFGQMGKFYVFSFIIGSIFLFYESIKKIKRAKILSLFYGLFIFSFVFSRYTANSSLNGETTLSQFMLVGSSIIFVLVITFLFLQSFYKNKETFNQIRNVDKKYTFIFVWFLFMILAATSAIRLLFEFTPITTIVVSFFVFYLVDRIWRLKNNYIRILGLLVIIVLLLNPLAFAKGVVPVYYERSTTQAQASGPGYNQLWQQAGRWARENTPEDAVFAHWWDYGYWVQSGFERATITDGGNFIGWWNFLMGRHVLSGGSTEDSLKFLYAHDADYVLALSDEIGKYPAYSLIGSDENLDRYSSIPVFSLDPSSIQETRNDTLLAYRGGVSLDTTVEFEGKIYPQGSAGIGLFVVPIQQNGDSILFKQPQAVVVYQGQQANIPVKCIYFEDQKQFFDGEGIDACLKIVPAFQGNQGNALGAAIYLSEKVKDSFFAKAYIGNEEIEGFELVYNSEGQIPLGLYQGRIFGPIRVWKINYPGDLELSDDEKEYYLRKSYPDDQLF